jgi:hypothetical protein
VLVRTETESDELRQNPIMVFPLMHNILLFFLCSACTAKLIVKVQVIIFTYSLCIDLLWKREIKKKCWTNIRQISVGTNRDRIRLCFFPTIHHINTSFGGFCMYYKTNGRGVSSNIKICELICYRNEFKKKKCWTNIRQCQDEQDTYISYLQLLFVFCMYYKTNRRDMC